MIDLPIFRAKRINSDEYVFGVPRQDSKGMYEMIINVVEDGIAGVIQRYIDADTISIHFPNMLDSQGNKIFASLQKDGRGGDIINCYLGKNQIIPTREKQIVKYYKPYYLGLASYDIDAYSKLEVIGIQQ